MNITYKKASLDDCELLIEINNKAYHDDYIRYGECPGYNVPIENMRSSLKNREIEKHIIYADDIPVGVTSVHNKGNNKYYLGNLCVIPEYQHKGIGKATIDFVLEHYTDLKELTLVTPADKIENVNFYTKKCNFMITGEEMDGSVKVARFDYKR
ncbi:MAG: GNAT family N-acetyltransferase [Clostridium sp.]|nr:GNAT family N-acetyltransferase [Clostridium sp.]